MNCCRYVGVAALAATAVLLGTLALVISNSTDQPGGSLLQALPFIDQQPVSSLSNRARTDLDPGSLAGLMQAAEGSGLGGDSRTTKLGMETEGDELAQLQAQETTQDDRKESDETAPKIRSGSCVRECFFTPLVLTSESRGTRSAIGRTIAKYFTTVRSVKDDQGTFLG
eukprot:2850012-Rhodomonas_salina.1